MRKTQQEQKLLRSVERTGKANRAEMNDAGRGNVQLTECREEIDLLRQNRHRSVKCYAASSGRRLNQIAYKMIENFSLVNCALILFAIADRLLSLN